jgi:hypothetical protein
LVRGFKWRTMGLRGPGGFRWRRAGQR